MAVSNATNAILCVVILQYLDVVYIGTGQTGKHHESPGQPHWPHHLANLDSGGVGGISALRDFSESLRVILTELSGSLKNESESGPLGGDEDCALRKQGNWPSAMAAVLFIGDILSEAPGSLDLLFRMVDDVPQLRVLLASSWEDSSLNITHSVDGFEVLPAAPVAGTRVSQRAQEIQLYVL